MWHRQRLQPLLGRARRYLFVRFASNIFPKLHAFIPQVSHAVSQYVQPRGT